MQMQVITGAGRITSRIVFFLLIWVCITFIPSAYGIVCTSPLPCARAAKHSTCGPELGALWSAPVPCCPAFLLCLHTHLLPFLSAYHPAAPSIRSSQDFTRYQTLQPSSQGRMNQGGLSDATLGSKGTASPGQAGSAVQMCCLLAGRTKFIPPTLDTSPCTGRTTAEGLAPPCPFGECDKRQPQELTPALLVQPFSASLPSQGTALLTAGLHPGPRYSSNMGREKGHVFQPQVSHLLLHTPTSNGLLISPSPLCGCWRLMILMSLQLRLFTVSLTTW